MGVPPEDVTEISILCSQFANVKTRFEEYEIESPQWFPVSGHITLAAYARIFLSDILPASWSKVLYLDCDLIVRRNLLELWSTELDGYAIAAVRDPGNQHHSTLGIPDSVPYINSGVLLVNLDYWRRNAVKETLIAFIRRYPEKLRTCDQDAINGCLNNCLLPLPDHWNVTHVFYLGPYEHLKNISARELLQLQRNPSIVHFTGPTKPWMYIMTHPFQSQYWSLLKRTPYGHALREKVTPRMFIFRQSRLTYRFSKRALCILYFALRGTLRQPTPTCLLSGEVITS
jgi:lipopolysaccharide biosynthesis glycosyltransferase